MNDHLKLNVSLLRQKVPNLTSAAREAGLRPATVSNLCTGKIPVGRAEVRTIVTLADIAGCTIDELIIRGGASGVIETGIKVVDLFAPFVRGGTTGFIARPGMGQLVMLAEIFNRLKQSDFSTVFWLPQNDNAPLGEVIKESDATCHSVDEVFEAIVKLQTEKDVVLGADRTIVLSGELYLLQEKLRESNASSVTFVLLDTRGEAMDEELPFGPLDTLWKFDMELVTRSVYPAIDPVVSTSTELEGSQLEAPHFNLQQKARKVLRRYRELRSVVQAWGIQRLSETDRTTYHRGERLEAFLTQTFYVAESYTNQKGEWVTLKDTLYGVQKILEGSMDECELDKLRFIGPLL